MSVDMSDPRVFGAFVGAVVALALWVPGRGYELVRDELRRRAIRHEMIRAPFFEITGPRPTVRALTAMVSLPRPGPRPVFIKP